MNKIADHGTLFSCLEMYLRNGKLSVVQCLMNEQEELEKHLPQVKSIPATFMDKSTGFKVNKQSQSLS